MTGRFEDYSTADAGKVRDALIVGEPVQIISQAYLHDCESHQSCDSRTWVGYTQCILPPSICQRLESKKRVSIPVDTVIRRIQQSCLEHDDDMRWLIALISDTGMRLAEAAGSDRRLESR